MPYNFIAESFHTKKLWSRLSSSSAILHGKWPFCVFEPPFGRLGATYVHLRFIGTGFPLYLGIEIQRLFKDFQGPGSCIIKDQFSTEGYSMDSIKAIFNIYFCDYGTVLVNKTKRDNY